MSNLAEVLAQGNCASATWNDVEMRVVHEHAGEEFPSECFKVQRLTVGQPAVVDWTETHSFLDSVISFFARREVVWPTADELNWQVCSDK